MMEKLSEKIEKRTANVLLIDKNLKNRAFSYVFEKDLRNLLDVYFFMENSSVSLRYVKGEMGKLCLTINIENVNPKKIGINS